jgi:hypothetical protein
VKNSVYIVIALALAGCTSQPTVQTGPNAEVSFDGLHKIDNSAFHDAWADPDADWGRYDQFIGGEAFFEYRAVKKTAKYSNHRPPASTDEFYIDEKSRERLTKEVTEIFTEELAKSERFTRTEEPGQNVLVIRGGLHDIVSRTPPELITRGEIYIRSFGEATLVLEVVDSMSGEVLARAVERREAGSSASMVAANTVTTWAEVRRLTRRWAVTLRKGLDGLPTE